MVSFRFPTRAACGVALSLACLPLHAADVSIVPAARTVAIDCHRMEIPDKSRLSVEVTRDAKRGLHVYRYTVRTSDPASPAVQSVLFEDMAQSRTTHSAPDTITIESAAAPGVVRYSLLGAVRVGLDESDLQQLATQFGGDRDAMQSSVDHALAESCAFNRAETAFEYGMTGTIAGPSAIPMLEAAFTGPAPVDSTDREVELRSDALQPDSIVVTDSRLNPLQVGPPALEHRADGTPVVRFTLDPLSARCNARGVLVRARMRDGTAVAGSLDIDPPACSSQVDQALLVVPPG